VWEKRDLKTANKLRKRIKKLGITCDRKVTDDWRSFIIAFLPDTHEVGKEFTVDIEGNNGTVQHRMRWMLRKTCCFSKQLLNHYKAFEIAFFYINYDFV
jgi:IS1 family transposase